MFFIFGKVVEVEGKEQGSRKIVEHFEGTHFRETNFMDHTTNDKRIDLGVVISES